MVDIKIGSTQKLRSWLRQQKKNGNAVQYVAVEDSRTGQRVMLVWTDPALKVVRPSSASSSSSYDPDAWLDEEIPCGRDDGAGVPADADGMMAAMKETLWEQVQLLRERLRKVTELKELLALASAENEAVNHLVCIAERERQ